MESSTNSETAQSKFYPRAIRKSLREHAVPSTNPNYCLHAPSVGSRMCFFCKFPKSQGPRSTDLQMPAKNCTHGDFTGQLTEAVFQRSRCRPMRASTRTGRSIARPRSRRRSARARLRANAPTRRCFASHRSKGYFSHRCLRTTALRKYSRVRATLRTADMRSSGRPAVMCRKN